MIRREISLFQKMQASHPNIVNGIDYFYSINNNSGILGGNTY